MEKAREKLEQSFQKAKVLKYKKRNTFLYAGDVPQGVYFLKKGYVRLYSVSPEGKELTLVIYEPGDFFPVVWGIQGERPSIYYFETLTVVEMKRVKREDFLDFVQKNPDVYQSLVNHILIRFQTALKQMRYLAFGNSYAKVVSAFHILTERFGEKHREDMLIALPLAHRDIATLVGLTRETVSLEIKKLEKKGYIAKRHGLYVIKNLVGLREDSLIDEGR